MQETIVAVFDTIAHADAAEADLRNTVAVENIRRYIPGESGAPALRAEPATTTTAVHEHEHEHGGFFAWLFGDEDHEDRSMYEEHASAGRTILSVRCVDASQATEVMKIMERHAATGVNVEHDTTQSVTPPIPQPTASTTGVTAVGGTAASSVNEPAAVADTSRTTEEVIPLASEELEVGKRVIDQGTTRIRRYAVQTPVEKTIGLRDETTTIERRTPVGETAVGTGAFEERIVEVQNTTEEPVVRKTAGVTEEVVVHKQATERQETVRDTVRREEVEVQNPTPTTGRPVAP